MPASGKTTLGETLGVELNLPFLDTDRIFEDKYGSIQDYVRKNSWSAFRIHEERIVKRELAPDTVLALGGGAIESVGTRTLLSSKSTVVWIQASYETIMRRLLSQQSGKERPALTDLPLEEETLDKLRRRDPLYQSIAQIVVSADMSLNEQVTEIQRQLAGRVKWCR